MQDKILRLCKRLKNCTINDLAQITEENIDVIQTILIFLEQKELIKIQDNIIFPLDSKHPKRTDKKNLNLMFQHRTEEEIEILLKGFCLQIPSHKLCHFINCASNCVCDYYAIFRKNIYERQFKSLVNNFLNKPQIGRYRIFYNKRAFFYIYNNEVFVSDKLLRANYEDNYTKSEIREFKKMYCYLSRIESHNTNENYLYNRLAESIWRRDKNFDYLYSNLKDLLNIS